MDCLPSELSYVLGMQKDVREIRLRNGRAVRVNVGGQWYFVGSKGLVQQQSNALILGETCDSVVKRACNNSIYAYEKMLANGFFTLEDGVRVGVCGQVAGSNEAVFQKYTSLCFRVPHHVSCVDNATFTQCTKGNVIVIGPPCSGKTTFLRDLSVKLSQNYNVLVVDERGELFYDSELLNSSCCDVLKWTSKAYAFEVGVRAMSPEWIVCDELSTDDIPSVKACVSSGVRVACSAHGFSLDDFAQKFDLVKHFDTAVILNQHGYSYNIKLLNAKV
ncbi:MAG: hypothetical protein J1F65_00745 [Clostridiales bacterium]|nr:hypothetical protein [Clostridiales bacterium]